MTEIQKNVFSRDLVRVSESGYIVNKEENYKDTDKYIAIDLPEDKDIFYPCYYLGYISATRSREIPIRDDIGETVRDENGNITTQTITYENTRVGWKKDETLYSEYLSKELDLVKEKRIEELRIECNTYIEKTFRYENKAYSLTLYDQTNIKSQYDLASLGGSCTYHADGENDEIFTLEKITSLYMEAITFVDSNTAKFRQLKKLVTEADTIDKVGEIVWDLGTTS